MTDLTRFEQIKAMTIDEMAKFLMNVYEHGVKIPITDMTDECNSMDCKEDCLICDTKDYLKAKGGFY